MNKLPRTFSVKKLSWVNARSPFVRFQLLALASMYIGYAAFMLCRNTLVACSVQIVQDPTLGIDWPLTHPPVLSQRDAAAPMLTSVLAALEQRDGS